MTPLIGVVIACAAAVGALAIGVLVYETVLRQRLAVRDRVRAITRPTIEGPAQSLFKERRQSNSGAGLNLHSWSDKFQERLDQAGLRCSTQCFIAICAALTVLATVGGWMWNPWLAPIGVTGLVFPWGFVNFRRIARQRTLTRQLPEAFAMISRAIKAGQTVPAALRMIADDFSDPIGAEFARCYAEQSLGVSRESALRNLASRISIMELHLFVVALLVQARSGGDLGELLDNLSSMVRKRLKLRERVRTLTGEGRMQALILILLPLAAFCAIQFVAPDYGQYLLDRPWIIVATLALELAGTLWIRKLINVRY